jgi:hypothetical protein
MNENAFSLTSTSSLSSVGKLIVAPFIRLEATYPNVDTLSLKLFITRGDCVLAAVGVDILSFILVFEFEFYIFFLPA